MLIISAPNNHNTSNNELIYTALTRTSNNLIIIDIDSKGKYKDFFEKAINN